MLFSHRFIEVQLYALDGSTAIGGNELAARIQSLSAEARARLTELGFNVEVREEGHSSTIINMLEKSGGSCILLYLVITLTVHKK